jgi:hypothetical protein
MNESSRPPARESHEDSGTYAGLGLYRSAAGVAAVALAVPLVVAALLAPSPAGMGTHRQLGLPPCSSVMLFGVRCPSCGMTTSFAHTVRGEFVAAARANLGGMLLAGLSAVGAVWLGWFAVRGRFPTERIGARTLTAVLVMIIVVTLGQWLLR